MYPKWYSRYAVLVRAIMLVSLVATSLLGGVAQANTKEVDSYTGELSISGTVTDESGNPLQNYGVELKSSSGFTLLTVTNEQGNYAMSSLWADTYEVRVNYQGLSFTPVTRTVTIPPNATGVNFQRVGSTPAVHDSGFRLNKHAWSFQNRAFVPEEKHLVGAFGADNARKFAGVVFNDGTGGSCFGYVVTASLLVHGNSLGLTPPVAPFVNTFSVPDPGEYIANGNPYFQPGVVSDYIIEAYYRQFSIENFNEKLMSRLMSFNEKINAIKQSVDDKFNSNPVVIALEKGSHNCNGHAVVPISYTVSLDGRTEVGVYDPNHPVGMNEHQTIIFDATNQSWSYSPRGESVSYGSAVVCTNANNQRLKGRIEVLHAKTYSKPTNPPWWQMPPGNAWIEVSNWIVSIKDAAGNILGDVGGEIVENIPNSFVFTPLDQLGSNSKSWYVVQTDTPITATVQYNNSTNEDVTIFAQKAVFDVGLAQGKVTTDTLVIDSSGGAVSLFGGGSRSITTTRLLTGTEQIFTLGMQASDQVRVQMLDDGSLKFFTATAQDVVLTLVQHGGDGEAGYQLSLPPFADGDAQVIIPQWQNNSATVNTDVGNDGTIDNTQTIQGETQQQSVYLPLIKR